MIPPLATLLLSALVDQTRGLLHQFGNVFVQWGCNVTSVGIRFSLIHPFNNLQGKTLFNIMAKVVFEDGYKAWYCDSNFIFVGW